jgi:hypothetical protein
MRPSIRGVLDSLAGSIQDQVAVSPAPTFAIRHQQQASTGQSTGGYVPAGQGALREPDDYGNAPDRGGAGSIGIAAVSANRLHSRNNQFRHPHRVGGTWASGGGCAAIDNPQSKFGAQNF